MTAWEEGEFPRLLELGLACLDLSFAEMREFVVWGRPPASEATSAPGLLFRGHSSTYWLTEVERPGGLVRWARSQTSPSSLTLMPHLGPTLLALSAFTGGGCGAVAFCNVFFLSYFLLVRSVFPAFSDRIAAWICTRSPFCENTRSVARGYRGIVKRFLAFVFQRGSCDPPLLRQNPRPVERCFAIKNYVPGLDPQSCVTVPSFSRWARAHASELDPREIRDRVTPVTAPSWVADHASALLASLQKRASDTPCGNPIQWMWYRLLVNSCLRSARCLLPVPAASEGGRRTGGSGDEEPAGPAGALTGPGGPCLNRDVFVAVVSRNVLSCLLNVPAAGPLAYKCFRSHPSRPVCGPDHPPLAVFCLDCGYCLNFGKQTGGGGGLNSFRPSLQFYPRDQKEKHVLTCHASGRVYCSNCGSPAVGCLRLAEPPSAGSGWQPRIRAVLPHNAAYELDRGSRLLDAIIPCLGPNRACMRPVVLRGVTVRQLLYLTLRADARAVCTVCQQQQQQRRQPLEEARNEPHLLFSCLEVELPPGEWCEGCRLYQTRYGAPAAQAHPPGEAGGRFSRQSSAS